MEEIYVNVEHMKPVDSRPSTDQTGSRSSQRRFHGAVVVCLGLLSVFLLAGLIGLGVHYRDSVRGLAEALSTIKANLTEERDLLNASLTEITKELHWLQSLSAQKRTCPTGWSLFNCDCYLISNKSDSWEKGRQDCRGRGADLVVIDSHGEQEFLISITQQRTWIGLSDREKEGTWKWTDGTPLTRAYWGTKQPDNGNKEPQWGEEDCAHIRAGETTPDNWNDVSCDASMPWICEKMP